MLTDWVHPVLVHCFPATGSVGPNVNTPHPFAFPDVDGSCPPTARTWVPASRAALRLGARGEDQRATNRKR
jgi:hypothetical protein